MPAAATGLAMALAVDVAGLTGALAAAGSTEAAVAGTSDAATAAGAAQTAAIAAGGGVWTSSSEIFSGSRSVRRVSGAGERPPP